MALHEEDVAKLRAPLQGDASKPESALTSAEQRILTAMIEAVRQINEANLPDDMNRVVFLEWVSRVYPSSIP